MITILEGKERNLFKHHPWVFSGAMDASTVPEAAGVEKVVSHDGRFIAWGWYDKDSHIPLRLLSWKEDDMPDSSWWERSVRESVLRRKSFFSDMSSSTNVFRIIHGEADLLPGLVADVYGRIVRIIVSARVAWDMRETVVRAIEGLLHPQMIILNTDSAFCAIEKLHEVVEYYQGGVRFTPAEKLPEMRIREDGLYYGLVPGTGQKSGFYCDQRENRKRLEQYVKDAVVFDGCC